MEVEFKGEKYLGSGQSKRDAKQHAAANALGFVETLNSIIKWLVNLIVVQLRIWVAIFK